MPQTGSRPIGLQAKESGGWGPETKDEPNSAKEEAAHKKSPQIGERSDISFF